MTNQRQFEHEQLEVFQRSLDYLELAEAISAKTLKGKKYLRSQVDCSALSLVLDVADAAEAYAAVDRVDGYQEAKRTAAKCSASLDACVRLGLLDAEPRAQARLVLSQIVWLLDEIVSMVEGHPLEDGWAWGQMAPDGHKLH